MLAGSPKEADIDLLTPRGKVLEIGAGYGDALVFLSDLGYDVYGTEANSHRAAKCVERGLRVFKTDVADLSPVAHLAPFDLIFSSHVLEHLTDLKKIVGDLRALLSDGGIFYVEVPNSPMAENALQKLHCPVHNHFFSILSLQKLLEGLDLRVIRAHIDINLHVTAVKSLAPIGLPVYAPGDSKGSVFHGLDHLSDDVERLRVHFDAYYVTVKDLVTGRVLYKRAKSYGIGPQPASTRWVFDLSVVDRGPGPLVFRHPNSQAPLWMKEQ